MSKTPGLNLPYGIDPVNAVPVDSNYGPYADVAAAKAAVPQALRYDGLTVMITGTGEYWWLAADLSDSGLIVKSSPGMLLPVTRDVYLVGSSTEATRMGGASNNVYYTFQAAYAAADALWTALGGGAQVVNLNVGTTVNTSSGTNIFTSTVGDLVLSAAYNAQVNIIGQSPLTSVLGIINGDNASGNGYDVVIKMSNVFVGAGGSLSISSRATGTTGNSGSINIKATNCVFRSALDTSITNASNTAGNGGTINVTGYSSAANPSAGGEVIIGSIVTSARSGGTGTSGNVNITSIGLVRITGNLTTANSSLGGQITLGSNPQSANGIFVGGITCVTTSTSNCNLILNNVTCTTITASLPVSTTTTLIGVHASGLVSITDNGNGVVTLTIDKSCIFGANFTTSSNVLMKASQSKFQRITTLGDNSVISNCTFVQTASAPVINGLGTGCSINNCTLLGGTLSIDNGTAVTVNVNESYLAVDPGTNVSLLRVMSKPQEREVYLVADANDALRMGGTKGNTYTTFQAAYDAAAALQVAAGGTQSVVINVGVSGYQNGVNNPVSLVGNLTLSANYNAGVIIRGISPHVSILGYISGENASGNGFSIGIVKISNVTIGETGGTFGISSRATGTTGNGGLINLRLSNVVIKAGVFSDTTNGSNTTGNGGNITIGGGSNDTNATLSSGIVLPSITTSATAGGSGSAGLLTITRTASIHVTGNITTANNTLGGSISLSGEGFGIFHVNGNISMSTTTTANNYFVLNNVTVTGTLTAVLPAGNQSISNCTFVGAASITDNGGGAVLLSINKTTFVVGATLTMSDSVTLTATNSTFSAISTLGSNSKLNNCSSVVSSGTNITTIGTSCELNNCSIIGGSNSITNGSAVTITVNETYLSSAPNSNVTLIRTLSLPVSRRVYLVADSNDAIRMGGTMSRVYTTFQTAYDAANALQVTLGGSNVVEIIVGHTVTTSNGVIPMNNPLTTVGNLVLSANYNSKVLISGISPFVSVLGSVTADNASGNAYTVSIPLTDVYLGSGGGGITARATGASGNSATVTLQGNNFVVKGPIDTSVTNASNTAGNGGSISVGSFVGSSQGVMDSGSVLLFGNLLTTAQPGGTGTAGTVSCSDSPSLRIFGNITTANNTIGGSIALGGNNTRVYISGNITSSAVTGAGGPTINLSNTTVSGSITFNSTFVSGGGVSDSFNSCSLAAVTLTDIDGVFGCTIRNTSITTLTTSQDVKVTIDNCTLSRFVNMGNNVTITRSSFLNTASNATISGFGTGCKIIDTTINGGTLSIDTASPTSISLLNTSMTAPLGSSVIADFGEYVVDGTSSLALIPTVKKYIFNGSSPATWTLYEAAVTVGLEQTLVNVGSATVTVNTAGGGNDIFDLGLGTSVNTISLPASSKLNVLTDGTNIIMFQ